MIEKRRPFTKNGRRSWFRLLISAEQGKAFLFIRLRGDRTHSIAGGIQCCVDSFLVQGVLGNNHGLSLGVR